MGKLFAFIKLKKVWIPFILVVAVAGLVAYQRQQGRKPQYSTEVVKKQDLLQTVSATGTVEAAEAISLTPKLAGRIIRLSAKVGDTVKPGQVLAQLESGDVQSAVLSARASLKSAEAALDKLKAGAQVESVAVAQAAVSAAETTFQNAQQSAINIKTSQARAVLNALSQLLGLPAGAVSAKTNTSTGSLTISGTYTGSAQGVYTLRIANPNTLNYSISGLENLSGVEGSRATTSALGSKGLRVQFSSSGTFVDGDTWTIEIPNTSSTSYSTYQAAYEAAVVAERQQVDTAEATVRSAEQALLQAQAQLALVQAPARTYDIRTAEAAVDSARANLIRAEADLRDRVLVAPAQGVVTQVNNEVGEITSPSKPVLVILTSGDREIKVQVPESDIDKLKLLQTADLTLDALGSAEHFGGHISFVDPASTVVADVVYYNVTVLFDTKDERIKPGMTANLDITTAKREGVLVAPLRAVKYDEARKPYVEVLAGGTQVERRDVVIGLRGDDGLVEVVSGLSESETVITFKQNGKS